MKKALMFGGFAGLGLLGLSVSLFLGARLAGFIFQHNIPSGSMAPGIPSRSYILTTIFPYWWHDPERGDVITFAMPSGETWIKRIIALPGDTVQMRHGQVILNGKALAQKRIKDWPLLDPFTSQRKHRLVYQQVRQYEEFMPSGVHYRIIDLQRNSPLDDTRLFTVPAGHYFVIGDNRDNSTDSRVANIVGSVPRKRIRSKLFAKSDILAFVNNTVHFLIHGNK